MSTIRRRLITAASQISKWLSKEACNAIKEVFDDDSKAVIEATDAYLSGLDVSKAQNLVKFINEDPMMVCSLPIEVSITMPHRFLVSDGIAEIYTPLGSVSSSDKETVKCLFNASLMSDEKAICGTPYPNIRLSFGWYQNKMGLIDASGWPQGNIAVTPNQDTDVEFNWLGTTATLKINGEDKGSYSVSRLNNVTDDLVIFSRYKGGAIEGGISYFERLKNDMQTCYYAPFKHKTGDNTYECGMLDLTKIGVEGAQVFWGNSADSGQFTIPDISYTPRKHHHLTITHKPENK